MKFLKKKLNIPETLHQPITKTNVHPLRSYNDPEATNHSATLSIQVGFDDNSTIENNGSKVVAVLLPDAPSFDYGVEFEDTDNTVKYDGEIPYKTIKFKPYLTIANILKKDAPEKSYIADVVSRVYPLKVNHKNGEVEWHSDSAIKDYISDQWQEAFDEITDAYSVQNAGVGAGFSYTSNTNIGKSKKAGENESSFLGLSPNALQWILKILIGCVLFYIGMSLYGAYVKNKNGYQSTDQNPYSGASIDKQVQIAEDVVAKVQGKMGVPALGENDLGCLQEVE